MTFHAMRFLLLFCLFIASISFAGSAFANDMSWLASSGEMKSITCRPNIPGTKEQIRALLASRGVNISEVYDEFDLEELQDITLAVMSLPQFLFSSANTLNIYYVPLMRPFANAVIHLSDAWRKASRDLRSYTIAHEIGHNMGGHDRPNPAAEIQNSMFWENIETPWIINNVIWRVRFGNPVNPAFSVSDYAKQAPHEDWAESFAVYRFDPRRLLDVSKKKYDLIKNFYGNIEYLNENECNHAPTFSFSIEAKDVISNLITSSKKHFVKAKKNCSASPATQRAFCTLKTWYEKINDKQKKELQEGLKEEYFLFSLCLWLNYQDGLEEIDLLQNEDLYSL